MNVPIVRLYAVLLALFAALVAFTSNWAVFDAEELEDKVENRRPLIEEQTIRRGTITTVDGVVVAESHPVGGGPKPIYVRDYPQGSLFAHPVGYSYVEVGRSGIERSENDTLVGEENEFASIIDQLRDTTEAGSDITLTIDAEAQRVATQSLQAAITAGNGGSVVALEPATGAVRAMVSLPTFDPNQVEDEFSQLNDAVGSPVLDRPTQSHLPPGSTMKVVTATAALDSGEFEPTTILNADSPKVIGGTPLENFGNDSFGDIDMTAALTNSVNTYWAQAGEQLGADTMFEYMERYGFNSDPEIDLAGDEKAPSGVYDPETGKLRGPDDGIDIGRVAIGQGDLEATTMQMAEVAATIANGGELMRPTLVQEVTDPDGRVSDELDPEVQSEVMSDETAAQLTEMMTSVTREGTASSLSVDAVEFAGKTGTAEVNLEGLNHPWFIGFAPAQDPQVAVAVAVERVPGGFGGTVAGPIATAVMESLLGG